MTLDGILCRCAHSARSHRGFEPGVILHWSQLGPCRNTHCSCSEPTAPTCTGCGKPLDSKHINEGD